MIGVHQLVARGGAGDSIDNHTLLLRRALRAAGWRSEIFVDEVGPEAEHGDVVVCRLVGTATPAGLAEAARDFELVVDYHRCASGRPEVPAAALALAHSAPGRADLVSAGCRDTVAVPALFEPVAAAPDVRVGTTVHGGDWLFVGPITPALAQHQLVKALWAYRRLADPSARLHLVGPARSGSYLRSLRTFTQDLGLEGAVLVRGVASARALAAYFERAGAYVSLAPQGELTSSVVGAMGHGLPVVALGGPGMLAPVGETTLALGAPEPAVVAVAVQRVLGDAALRERLVATGRRVVGALAGAGRRSVEVLAGCALGPAGGPSRGSSGARGPSPAPGRGRGGR